MTVREAASKLRQELLYDTNVVSIGIAEKGQYNPEDHMCIYTKKKPKVKYPEEYEGFRVKVIKIGKIEIKRSKDGGI